MGNFSIDLKQRPIALPPMTQCDSLPTKDTQQKKPSTSSEGQTIRAKADFHPSWLGGVTKGQHCSLVGVRGATNHVLWGIGDICLNL